MCLTMFNVVSVCVPASSKSPRHGCGLHAGELWLSGAILSKIMQSTCKLAPARDKWYPNWGWYGWLFCRWSVMNKWCEHPPLWPPLMILIKLWVTTCQPGVGTFLEDILNSSHRQTRGNCITDFAKTFPKTRQTTKQLRRLEPKQQLVKIWVMLTLILEECTWFMVLYIVHKNLPEVLQV